MNNKEKQLPMSFEQFIPSGKTEDTEKEKVAKSIAICIFNFLNAARSLDRNPKNIPKILHDLYNDMYNNQEHHINGLAKDFDKVLSDFESGKYDENGNYNE